jgi:hypothetical protein
VRWEKGRVAWRVLTGGQNRRRRHGVGQVVMRKDCSRVVHTGGRMERGGGNLEGKNERGVEWRGSWRHL